MKLERAFDTPVAPIPLAIDHGKPAHRGPHEFRFHFAPNDAIRVQGIGEVERLVAGQLALVPFARMNGV